MTTQNKWVTKNIQKSLSFIFPYLGLSSNPCITTSYMGTSYLSESWGEQFILDIDPSKDLTGFQDTLRVHPYFIFEKELESTKIHFIFSIPTNIKETVVKPFLDGKYSEISELYKTNGYYPKYLEDGTINPNYQILYKDPALKMVWEYLIGESIGDQEVSSKPEKEDEIYGWINGTPDSPEGGIEDRMD